MKILIAIPSARSVETECFASILNLKRKGQIGLLIPNSYSIDSSRNLIAQHAIENNYDYILWVDSDMIIPPDTLVKFLEHKKDIVSGVYAYKILGGENAVAKRFIPTEDDTYEDIPLKEIRESDRLMELDGIGFGCVLTKTKIFKKIPYPYFVYTPEMGEDIYFCRKAQEQGYKIYMDTSIKAGHIGTVNYNI